MQAGERPLFASEWRRRFFRRRAPDTMRTMSSQPLVRRGVLAVLAFCAIGAATPGAQAPAPQQLGVKYMRDSEEYAALARQTYRMAGDAVTRAATAAGRQRWAVVLDIDETALDNSTYQLERGAYQTAVRCEIVERLGVPARGGRRSRRGRVRFARAAQGGHVAWITNRDRDVGRGDARESESARDVDRRRSPVRAEESGAHESDAACRGRIRKGRVLVGRRGDAHRRVRRRSDGRLPRRDRTHSRRRRDDAFGRICFLLPNSMYGDWVAHVRA